MIVKSIGEVNEKEMISFSCGNNDLDTFIRRHALINDKNGYGKTFVLIDEKEIVGFFTLCSASIKYDEFTINESMIFPKYPIPCIKIARLGVRKEKHGRGYGKELLKQAFLRVLNVSSTIGIRLVLVDAKEPSKSFYEKFGFSRLKEDKLSYYLLIDTLRQAIY